MKTTGASSTPPLDLHLASIAGLHGWFYGYTFKKLAYRKTDFLCYVFVPAEAGHGTISRYLDDLWEATQDALAQEQPRQVHLHLGSQDP